MPRNTSHQALILKSRASGESNRDIWLLTAEEGLLRATVFGGPKSRLRSHAAPFNSGQAWIYHDPVKDSRKISDFDVQSWRPGLRELYDRSMAAGAVAETVLASHGGGGHWGEALSLAEVALDTLETADEALCGRVLVRFLWRWVGLLGLQPDLERCAECGKPFASDEDDRWYSAREGGILCADCADNGSTPGLLRVGGNCTRFLSRKTAAPDTQAFREAQVFSTSVLAEALGKRLSSWEW